MANPTENILQKQQQYFKDALTLAESYNTYQILADGGITPSMNTVYEIYDILSVIKTELEIEHLNLSCKNGDKF